jgi:hypothetical protein
MAADRNGIAASLTERIKKASCALSTSAQFVRRSDHDAVFSGTIAQKGVMTE